MNITGINLENTLKILSHIIKMRDDIFDLNMTYCGVKLDLKSLSWQEIDRDKYGTVWFERVIEAGSVFMVFRIACTPNGYWRTSHAYQLAPGCNPGLVKINMSAIPKEYIKKIKTELDNAIIESASTTVQDELERVILDVDNPVLPMDIEKDYRRFLHWGGELDRFRISSGETAIRIINGMLRFGDFCPYGDIMAFAAFAAADLHYSKAAAILTKMALEKKASAICHYWYDLGESLDYLKDSEGAFSCYVNAWNLNKQEKSYSSKIWIIGARLIPLFLQAGRFDDLLPVAEALMQSVNEDINIRMQADALCCVGMVYEAKHDLDEAEKYYTMAMHKRQSNNKNSEDHVLYSMAWQSLWRLKTHPDEIREKYFNAQIKSFPLSPLEAGFDGRVPVEYVPGNPHGSHWGTLLPEFDKLLPVIPAMVQKGIMDGVGPELPLAELGHCKFIKTLGVIYQLPEETSAPAELMTVLGQIMGENGMQLATGFPKLKTGVMVEFEVLEIQEWMNGIEATAEVQLNNEQRVNFFIPDYYRDKNKIKAHHNYMVELAGFGYTMSKFEPVTIKIESGPLFESEKERLRKEGKSDAIESVPVYMTENTCRLGRNFSTTVDDIDFIGKVESVNTFKFLGNDSLEVVIKFNEEQYKGIKLPVYIGVHKLNGYAPKAGDTVEGTLWLQGILRKDLGKIEHNTEDEENDNDFGLLSGIKGTEFDLSSMAERALKLTSKASEISKWETPKGNDPDLVCRIKDKNHFIKVIHGYFDDEKSFYDEVRKRSVPALLLNKYPLEYVAVGGIKLGDDFNRIHYSGFEELLLK